MSYYMQLLVLFDSEHAIANSLHILIAIPLFSTADRATTRYYQTFIIA
jgi:hypothetical protein